MKNIRVNTVSGEKKDAVASFTYLKNKYPDAFFFQSHSIEGLPNLSIIGLDYYETIRSCADRVEVINADGTTIITQDFLSYLSDRLKSLEQHKTLIPYSRGGAFGCLGYEMIAQMEPKLNNFGYFQKTKEATEVNAEIFFSRNLIIFEHQKDLIHFILSDHEISSSALRAEVTDNNVVRPVTKVSFANFKAYMGKDKFLKSVEVVQEHIKAGDIFQAVLSERYERACEIPAIDLFASIKKVCHSTYCFYFDFKASSYFGYSPEVFVKNKDNLLETHPIAGTMPRGRNSIDDDTNERILNESIKEGAEHLMLVDLARNDLGRISLPGTVQVKDFRKTLRLSNVMHLVSVVTGIKAEEKSNMEVITSCFPAGTLSGAPKIRAMEILSGLEKGPRGFYGGAVVAFDHTGDLDSCIAIRAVEVSANKLVLRAGAGIVADSDPESEYQEVQHKLKALVSAIDHSHMNLPVQVSL